MKKHKFTIITLILIFGKTLLTFSQSSDIVVTSEKGTDNSITFNYEKRVPGSYTISVKFNNLQNAISSDYEGVVKNSSGTLFRLRPQNANESIIFSYSYTYVRGDLKAKPDTAFVYTLPFKKGKKVKPMEMSYIGKTYFKDTEPVNWKAFRFSSSTPDTACAIRKGIVVKIEDMYDTDTTLEVSFTSNQNSILIEHEDGTVVLYKGFLHHGILVKEGDTVYPQTNLGILSRYDKDKKYNLSIQLYYVAKMDMDAYLAKSQGQKLGKQAHLHNYINPVFMSKEGNSKLTSRKEYEIDISEEILTKEFTKRELKNYKKTTQK
jgi:hypothetical protein